MHKQELNNKEDVVRLVSQMLDEQLTSGIGIEGSPEGDEVLRRVLRLSPLERYSKTMIDVDKKKF